MITGMTSDYNGEEIYFGFNKGAFARNPQKPFVEMPPEIAHQPISLWNVALEFHTARIYKVLFGRLYILFIPLLGLFVLFILISGFLIWFKSRKKKLGKGFYE